MLASFALKRQGDLVIVEEREAGVLIRPAIALPLERYSPERKAEFLLGNAVDARDYARARAEVKKLGLNPDAIPHRLSDLIHSMHIGV